MILILVSFFLWLLYVLLLLWSRRAWKKAGGCRPELGEAESVFISVIIPARNEEDNIMTCLRALLVQDHPADKYEIIVVDDHSEDRTAERVANIKDPRLKLIRLQEVLTDANTGAFKKKGIEAAVKAAKGELMVTTDADCMAGPGWLAKISACYRQSKADVITMPVRIKSRNHPLSIFETLDFLSLQGMTGALVSGSRISMANGANLCYTRDLFIRINGFEGIDHIASGDDMLLVEKARAAGAKVIYLKDPDVIVETNPSRNLRSFLSQRIRWASKTSGYKDRRIQWLLLLVYLLNFYLLILLIRSMQDCPCGIDIGGGISTAEACWMLLAGKTFFEMLFLWPVTGFFGQRKLLWYFPLAQIPHILYTVCSGLLGLFGTYEWKGRRVK